MKVAPDFSAEYSYDRVFFNFLFYLIQIDPFLQMVEDHKLKAVNSDQLLTVAYGCEEDDASALNTLSNIAVSTEHSRGTLVYEIVKSLEDMCNVSVSSHYLPASIFHIFSKTNIIITLN